jgi:hypothetical protein
MWTCVRWSAVCALVFGTALIASSCFKHHDDEHQGWSEEDEDWEGCWDCSWSQRPDAGPSRADAGAAPYWPGCLEENDGTFYVSREAKVCDTVSFTCAGDKTPFWVDCGCGCTDRPPCPDPNDPLVHYLGADPAICAEISFTCPDECQPFNDACGCGCIEPAPPPCPDPADPAVHYFGHSPEACAGFDFSCAPGCDPFDDACGCGCIER